MKKLLLGVLLAITLFVGVAAPARPTYAATDPTQAAKSQVCNGVSGNAGGTCGTGGADISKIIKAVLNILSVIAGVAGVIMVIIAGMRYITSSGEAQAVSGAKRSLIYALVGLVVVAMAQLLVHFVLGATN